MLGGLGGVEVGFDRLSGTLRCDFRGAAIHQIQLERDVEPVEVLQHLFGSNERGLGLYSARVSRMGKKLTLAHRDLLLEVLPLPAGQPVILMVEIRGRILDQPLGFVEYQLLQSSLNGWGMLHR